MSRGHDFGLTAVLCLANGLLFGIALGTARPVYYLALAAAAGSVLNLAYIVAGRLWARP